MKVRKRNKAVLILIRRLKEGRREAKAILQEMESRHPYPWENETGTPRHVLVCRVIALNDLEYPRHTTLCLETALAIMGRKDEVAIAYLHLMIAELLYHIRRNKLIARGSNESELKKLHMDEEARRVF